MATLRDVGLTEYDARVYRTLLRTGPTTAKQLSSASGVPMGRIYDVLNDLEGTGLVRSQHAGRPAQYAAVEPRTALARVLEDHRRELTATLERYDATVEELAEQLDDPPSADEPFWTVAIGPADTVELLCERLAAAIDRLVMVVADPSAQFDLHEVGGRGRRGGARGRPRAGGRRLPPRGRLAAGSRPEGATARVRSGRRAPRLRAPRDRRPRWLVHPRRPNGGLYRGPQPPVGRRSVRAHRGDGPGLRGERPRGVRPTVDRRRSRA